MGSWEKVIKGALYGAATGAAITTGFKAAIGNFPPSLREVLGFTACGVLSGSYGAYVPSTAEVVREEKVTKGGGAIMGGKWTTGFGVLTGLITIGLNELTGNHVSLKDTLMTIGYTTTLIGATGTAGGWAAGEKDPEIREYKGKVPEDGDIEGEKIETNTSEKVKPGSLIDKVWDKDLEKGGALEVRVEEEDHNGKDFISIKKEIKDYAWPILRPLNRINLIYK